MEFTQPPPLFKPPSLLLPCLCQLRKSFDNPQKDSLLINHHNTRRERAGTCCPRRTRTRCRPLSTLGRGSASGGGRSRWRTSRCGSSTPATAMKMDSVEANGTLLLHFKLCIDASIALLTFADNFVGRLFLPGLYRGGLKKWDPKFGGFCSCCFCLNLIENSLNLGSTFF